MKILTILTLLVLLNNCSGSQISRVTFGKKCTPAVNDMQEASYIWFVDKDVKDFNKRINKKNCLETFPPRDHVDGMFAAKIRKC